MTQINLLKHQGLSFESFKTWLDQFIANKKGALPDLSDWKLIKEKLDTVTARNTISHGVSITMLNYCGTSDDEEYNANNTPWADLDDESDKEWFEIDDEMNLQLINEINYLIDLQNTPCIDIRITHDKRKESEDDANGICEGI